MYWAGFMYILLYLAGVRYINNDFYNFVLDATMARQSGQDCGKTVRAYGIFAKLGYRLDHLWGAPLLSLRETYATGGKTSEGVIQNFDPAFGANDRYYGRMNIVRWSNLDNREVMLEMWPIPEIKVELNFNWYYIPEPDDVVFLGNLKLQEGEHHLGNEWNIFIDYKVSVRWQLTGVFGYFMPGRVEFINDRAALDASWFAAQVLFTL